MEGAALAPPKQVTRQGYLIVTIVLGIAGSFVAMAAFGDGTYRVGPMLVHFGMRPATSGTTELTVEPFATGLKAGSVVAQTHSGFLALRSSLVGSIGESNIGDTITNSKDPLTMAEAIRDNGKTAFRKWALRLGLVVLAGGGAGGFAMALVGLKARRIFQGALAGVLTVGLLGLLAWQTYDIKKFSTVQFKPAGVTQILR